MRPNELTEGKRWLQQGERDLDDARFALSGNRFNLACFLAQQSAEKVLKGYLYFKGAEEVWGHSVSELCGDASGFDKEFETLKKMAASLDKYYIPTRYPNGLPGGIPAEAFDKDDAEKAISLAESVYSFVEERLL
ncbi:MAG: DNA-binding protein [candidate division Zixibacteria bacterium SM1_73]|nr:MAG: DNA-binding protein [candidate division Zixibacteria bacterium SM1_73]